MTTSSPHHGLMSAVLIGFRRLFFRAIAITSRATLLSVVPVLLLLSPANATDASNRAHAIELAKEQNGGDGKVLGVVTETDSAGNTQFAVKLLSNGRIRVFTIKKAL